MALGSWPPPFILPFPLPPRALTTRVRENKAGPSDRTCTGATDHAIAGELPLRARLALICLSEALSGLACAGSEPLKAFPGPFPGVLLARGSPGKRETRKTKRTRATRPRASSRRNAGTGATSITGADAQTTLNPKMAKRPRQPNHQLRTRPLPRQSRAGLSKCRLTISTIIRVSVSRLAQRGRQPRRPLRPASRPENLKKPKGHLALFKNETLSSLG